MYGRAQKIDLFFFFEIELVSQPFKRKRKMRKDPMLMIVFWLALHGDGVAD